MSKLFPLLRFAWLILLVLAQVCGSCPTEAQTKRHFDQNAVWSPSPNALKELNDCLNLNTITTGTQKEKSAGMLKCNINTMKKHGASQQAAEFAKLLSEKEDFLGYMSSFEKKGIVDLCVVTFPSRANTNEVLYMVNGSPAIISTEDHLKNINIKRHPVYVKLLKKFPRLELWQCSGFRSMESLPQGGQRLIFSYFLKDGCNACKVGGSAIISYDFDQNGSFIGTKLLDITDQIPR